MTSTAAMVPRVADTVPELLRRRLGDDSGAAIVDPDGTELTCEEWYERALNLAHGLAGRGVAPGDRVFLVADNRHWTQFAISYVGTLMAGAVAAPVSPSAYTMVVNTRPELTPALTVTHGDIGLAPGEATGFAELDGRTHPTRPLPALSGELPAEIAFTAGTEGPPKAVLSCHETLGVTYTSDVLASQPSEGWRYLLALPFGNTFAQTIFLDALQVRGARLYTAGDFRPGDFVGRLARFGIDITFLVPAMAEALVREPGLPWEGARGLKVACLAGAPPRMETLAAVAGLLPRTVVVNSYCSTEAWPAGSEWVYRAGDPLSAGTPWEGRELRIEDESGDPCPPGVAGTVCLRSNGVRQRRLLGADASPTDGWIRTDDVGFLDDDGRLSLVGRRGEIFTVGGVQVSPALVETALTSHPRVRDAVVLPRPHPTLQSIPVAMVVTTGPVTDRELLSWTIDAVGAERAPRALYRITEIPRNDAGKIVRSAANDLLERLRRRAAALDDPQALPARLRELIATTLKAAPLPPGNVNFFEAGGDSMAAVRLCRHIERDYGVTIELRQVFENPGLSDLASVIRRTLRAE